MESGYAPLLTGAAPTASAACVARMTSFSLVADEGGVHATVARPQRESVRAGRTGRRAAEPRVAERHAGAARNYTMVCVAVRSVTVNRHPR